MPMNSAILRAVACGALALAGGRAAAQVQVTVTPKQAAVLQGTSRTFTAVRSDHGPAHWHWSLVSGPGGGHIGSETGEYHAPLHVAIPTPVELQVTDQDEPEVTARVQVLATPNVITLVGTVPVLEDSGELPLSALRGDGAAPTWAWEIPWPRAGRITERQGQFCFQPPRVTEPIAFTLQVRDTAHPGNAAAMKVRVVPALVAVRLAEGQRLPLRSGQACELEATRADGLNRPWSWKVLEAGGGTLQVLEGGRARYVAPRVAVPTPFHVQAATPKLYGAVLALEVEPTISLTAATSTHLLSGQTCVLKATGPDPAAQDPPRKWRWEVLDRAFPDARLEALADPDKAAFTAPWVASPTPVTVEVRDAQHPDDPSRIVLQVLPRLAGLAPGTEAVFQQVMPGILGDDWLAPVPQATLLAGRLGLANHRQQGFDGVNCIRYVEEDPALGRLSRTWLVGDRHGLHTVDAHGRVGTWGLGLGEVTAIAIRPRGSAPGNPLRIAIATTTRAGTEPRGMVSLLGEDAAPEPLAGTLGPVPEAARVEGGRGHRVAFGRIDSLAWTAEGALDVVDDLSRSARIRRIAPDGEVTWVLRLEGGTSALAWDPVRGRLFGALGNQVRTRTLDEAWQPLAGAEGAPGFKDLPMGHGDEAQSPCLSGPLGLQLLGDHLLFLADTGNQALRVFNLETKVLQTLVGRPDQTRARLGPLAFAAPALPPEVCAALAMPKVFALNAEGGCLVAQNEGLVHLDLSAFAQAPPEQGAEEAAAAAAPKRGRARGRKRPAHAASERPRRIPAQPQP